MNVFEDLVVELQRENLLEMPSVQHDEPYSHSDQIDVTEVPNTSYDLPEYGTVPEVAPVSEEVPEATTEYEFQPQPADETEQFHAVVVEDHSEPEIEVIHPSDEVDEDDMSIHETVAAPMEPEEVSEPAVEAPVEEEQPPSKRPKTGREFFKKRAMNEVSSLQMVEHVVTGVEREYMKVVPKVFDDFNTKKALHTFLHVDEEINSEEHATAEFTLMQETEAWCTALADRDRNMPVSSLRQYCERSRPALSSQALLALARFYRNLPYSEQVRSKFDFVITRLFSRAVGQEKRVCLFTRDETLNHINTLYSDWSSIPLYTAEDDESKVMLTALSFDDLSIEAENASAFDQLIESDFFGRLRLFKESISELFYAPQVTAAAIDCNIRIGNAYVELIDRERKKMDAASVQSKYGDANDQTVSEATGQSLQLVDLLRELSQNVDDAADPHQEFQYEFDQQPLVAETSETDAAVEVKKVRSPFLARILANAFSVNKWFLAAAIVLILASVGVYVWANYFVNETVSTVGVRAIDVQNTSLKPYIKTARVSGETFYGQMLPLWDRLPKDKREEFLQVAFKAAQEFGCKQVVLLTKDGKSAAYASATRFEVVMP